MSSNVQNGLLLVLGTIVAAIGWFAFYPGDSTVSAEKALEIMADPTVAKVGILLGYGGFLVVMIGLFNLTRGMFMAGGKGSFYANIAMVLTVALATGSIIALGLEYATAETSNSMSGQILMGVADAAGGGMQLALGLTMVLLSAGIALSKNLHIIAAAIAAIAGVILLVDSFVDSDALEMAGWLTFMVTALIAGGLMIRKKS